MSKIKKEGLTDAAAMPSDKNTNYNNNNTNIKKQSTKGRGRHRNFATVIYPESAPDGWLQMLEDSHIAALLSPLHDQDMNPTGEPKKPHWHLLLMYDGVKTDEQAQVFIQSLGGVGCEVVQNIRGYARYLIHADNPEKAQYSSSSVRAFAGADFDGITHLPTDDVKTIKEMCAYIRKNQVRSFAQFADICAESYDDWYRALVMKCSYFIKEYIKSLTWEECGGGAAICNGEVNDEDEENRSDS